MKSSEIWVVIGAVVIGGMILRPIYPIRTENSDRNCGANLHKLASALTIYASDHDTRLPDRDSWMDAELTYLPPNPILSCPKMPEGTYGYAFNARLSLAAIPKAPREEILLFESINPIRNASDFVTSVPNKSRHQLRNVFAYTDGHIKRVPSEVRE